MSLVGGWLLAPLVLAVVVCGFGLLAERAAGVRLAGALVPGLGLSALIAVAGLATMSDATAELAVPACALLAAAGLALGAPWADPRLRVAYPWAIGVAAAAFVLYAAPSLLSGQGSITGYIKLDDSATFLAATDHIFSRGRDTSGVEPSTFSATIGYLFRSSYPVGSFMPLGVAGKLSGQDIAAAYQAVIAVLAAVLALALYSVAREFVRSRAAAAIVAVVGVQASMLFGYSQWGGIKEVLSAAMITCLAALVAGGRDEDRGRRLVLAALPAGALLTIVGINGLAWAGPGLLVGAIAVAATHRADVGGAIRVAVVGAAVLAVAALPALTQLGFAGATTGGPISDQDDLGNLISPLPLIQGAGLYPVGDFRHGPDLLLPAQLLALLTLALAAGAVAQSARRRLAGIPVLALVFGSGSLAAVVIGSPWIDAKAFAIVSPAILTCAAALLAAALAGHTGRLRAAAAIGAVVLLGGHRMVDARGHTRRQRRATRPVQRAALAPRQAAGAGGGAGLRDLRKPPLPARGGGRRRD